MDVNPNKPIIPSQRSPYLKQRVTNRIYPWSETQAMRQDMDAWWTLDPNERGESPVRMETVGDASGPSALGQALVDIEGDAPASTGTGGTTIPEGYTPPGMTEAEVEATRQAAPPVDPDVPASPGFAAPADEPAETFDTPPAENPETLEDQKFQELLAMAKTLGLPYIKHENKPALIERIRASQE